MTMPSGVRTLVLNDDYVPLNIVSWKRGMKRTFDDDCENCNGRGRINGYGRCPTCLGVGTLPPATVVAYYKLSVLDGRGNEHPVPAVIANNHHVSRIFKNVPFSRPNILKRDNYTCQYCGISLNAIDLTLDHVVPRSMWKGSTTPTCWANIVAACRKCNHTKANKTPEQANMQLRKLVNGVMVPYKYPKKPNHQEMMLGLTGKTIPEEWIPYLERIMKSQQIA